MTELESPAPMSTEDPQQNKHYGTINVLRITAHSPACVIYRNGTPLKHVLESIRLIARRLETQLEKGAK